MKLKTYFFQVCIVVFLFSTLFFSLSWALIHFQNPVNSLKEAISLTLTLLGPLTTLAAAAIAIMLFTDWRVVKKYDIIHNYIMIIKKEVQDLINYINNNRSNFVIYKLKLSSQNLTFEEYTKICSDIFDIEKNIINRLNVIGLEMNELFYLKHQLPEDPLYVDLVRMIKNFDQIGINKNNYHQIWNDRLTTNVFNSYFYYITDNLTSFIYDHIMVQYLDDLILKEE